MRVFVYYVELILFENVSNKIAMSTIIADVIKACPD